VQVNHDLMYENNQLHSMGDPRRKKRELVEMNFSNEYIYTMKIVFPSANKIS
jgi:hypothetical protein